MLKLFFRNQPSGLFKQWTKPITFVQLQSNEINYPRFSSALKKIASGNQNELEIKQSFDFISPGKYAKESIPATEKYANKKQRQAIQLIGNKYGCHSCGKKVEKFWADHKPCKALIKKLKKAMNPSYNPDIRFYPHCPSCSSAEGCKLRAQLNVLA